MSSPARIRPFLKWAGGKYRLVDRLLTRLPAGKRLVEPFVGAGALFLNADYEQYLLADINTDLIELYRQLQQDSQSLIDACEALFSDSTNQRESYLALREEFNQCLQPFRRSCLFLYLNRHGYNGLCRYNRQGGFNVPFGRYKRPYFPRQELQHAARRCQRAELVCADFATLLSQTREGDVVYCDPPYAALNPTSNFTQYHHRQFGHAEQQQLASLCQQQAQRGIPVLLSNHATPLTEQLYLGAELQRFPVQRHISCQQRRTAEELLAFYPAESEPYQLA